MGAQRHSIKRQVLELTLADSRDAWRLQQELGRIYRQRLVPLIERCCDELSTPDCLYRLERLELDLGAVDIGHLESEFVARVSAQLKPRLAEQIERQERGDSAPDNTPKVHSQLELFTLFVRQGSLPWWADPAQPHLLENSLDYLLHHTPDQLHRLLSELVQEEGALQRLIRHYDDRRLTALAALHTAELGDIPAALFQAMMVARKSTGLLAGASVSEFRRRFWHIILQVAALSDTPHRDPLSFCRSALMRLAVKCSMPYTTLLKDLYKTLPGGGSETDRKIREIIEMLMDDATAKPGSAGVPAGPLTSPGSAGVPAGPLTSPGSAGAPAGPLTSPGSAGIPAGPLQQILTPTIDEAERNSDSSVDLNFSDTDELYIDTAGLVLLWPFLGHFFERLGLITENRFQDDAAVQRAVGLLHYLATEETDPPEYRLPLAKVLCGMEPDALFLLEPSLNAEELDECGLLLSATIEHAPILHNMSIAGFRSTFLRRQGILGQRDGAWLLRVERETYDIVLERFPWSVEWVKLPWMAVPLRVEW